MKKSVLLISICFLMATFNIASTMAAGSQTPTSAIDSSASSGSATQALVVKITDAWARKSMSPNNNSAAYMKISNGTDQDVTIVGAAASSVANNVELHKSFVDEKGVSRMTSIDKIVVPAKSAIELAPGATHIMLFDLKRNLNAGDKFNIEIKIEGNLTPLLAEVEVK